MSELVISPSYLDDTIGRQELTTLNSPKYVKCHYGQHYFLEGEVDEHNEICIERKAFLSLRTSMMAAQFPPGELAVKVSKKFYYNGSSEIEAGPAFKRARLAEPAPHFTYWKTKEAPRKETPLKKPINSSDGKTNSGRPVWSSERCNAFFSEIGVSDDSEDSDDSDENWTEFQCSADNPDDLAVCLKEEDDDLDIVPKNLKKEIDDFTQIKFWPAVFEYLGKEIPKFRCFSVADLENDGLNLPVNIEVITREMNYDLSKAEDIVGFPDSCFRKIDGKSLVGSVIRICKIIDKQELGDQIYQIVQKCFIPDEHQDLKDPFRADFGLCVET